MGNRVRGGLSFCRLPWFERVTLVASGLTLALMLAAWGLMRFGAFSLPRVLGSVAVVALVLGVLAWRRRRAASEGPARETWHAAAALGFCAAFGLLYAWYPTYFLLGGQDPGPYLAFAARIAKTGGLELHVPEIAEWARAHPGMLRNFPAVYGDLTAPPGSGALEAQFLHLFTAYDAVFFALGRVEGAVRANAWLATLCLATGFALVRRLGSPLAAFGLLLALGLNPAFVWASRITLTEILALWLNLSGLLLLVLAWDLASAGAAALAGAAFGLGVLNRIDGGLGSFAVLGFAVAALLAGGPYRRAAAAAALGHLVTSAFAYRDAYELSGVYCRSLAAGSSSVTALPIVTSALDVLALACAVAPSRLLRALRVNETTLRLAAYAAVWGGILWLTFGLFFRPLLDPAEEARSMRELTWYVGWGCWPLFVLGLGLAVRSVSFQRCLPFVAFALGTLVIYTARTDVAPIHIWASRRWVQHVIPLVLVSAALAVPWLVARLRTKRASALAVTALALVVLVPVLDFTRLFLFKSMLRGLAGRYERVADYARSRPEKLPVLTDRVHFGSILSYVYDVPTAVLFGAGAEAFARGDFAGQLGVGFHAFDLRHTVEVPGAFGGAYLGPTSDERPSEIVSMPIPLDAGPIGDRVFEAEMPAAHWRFRSQVGRRKKDGSVVSKGKEGQLLLGPWMDLIPGRYRIEWYGRVASAGTRQRHGLVDVIFEAGKKTIVEAPLLLEKNDAEHQLAALDFTVEHPLEGLEFRLRIRNKVGVTLTKLRLARFGEPNLAP
jgi:hypothetical protein